MQVINLSARRQGGYDALTNSVVPVLFSAPLHKYGHPTLSAAARRLA